MSKKRAAKATTSRGIRTLSARKLGASNESAVKGGFVAVEHSSITKEDFSKIDGIPGESLDDKHYDWIEILGGK